MALCRKCDVLNRGFSGYNTRWVRLILQSVLPPETIKEAVAATVFLGANDSSLQEVWPCQWVGLEEYADNLKVRLKLFQIFFPGLGRVPTVMKNLEKSWKFENFFFQPWKSYNANRQIPKRSWKSHGKLFYCIFFLRQCCGTFL